MKHYKPLSALMLLLSTLPAFGQGTVLQGGGRTAGHAPMYVGTGSGGQTTVQDSGPASGGAVGLGLSELLMTKRGTGTPPYANGGTGPYATTNCMYDAPTTNATGYHYFCFDPNAQGGGLIAYGAAGVATALPLQVYINGILYPFPGTGSGNVVGPVSTTVGHLAVWNNTVGTLLADVPITADNAGKLTTVGLVVNPYGSSYIPVISGVALGTLPKASSETADSGCYSAFSNDSNTPIETFLQMNLCLITHPTPALRHVLIECIEQHVENCDVYINPSSTPNQGAVTFGSDFWWGTVGSNPTSLGLGTVVPQSDANVLAAKLVIKGTTDVGLTINAGNTSTANIFLGSPSNTGSGQIRYNNNTNVMTYAVAGSTVISFSTSTVTSPNSLTMLNGTAIPAGGTAGAGIMFSSVANYGVFFGSSAPSLSAAKGSIYLRSDGSSSSTRAYINSDGGTTWVAITTAS